MAFVIRYIKHSEKTVRKGNNCQVCGTDQLYWAHEQVGPVTPATPGYCKTCKSAGRLVIVDVDTIMPHSCVETPETVQVEPEDPFEEETTEGIAEDAMESPISDQLAEAAQAALDALDISSLGSAESPAETEAENEEDEDESEPPCDDDDEFVTHRELNEIDPARRPEVKAAFDDVKKMFGEVGKVLGNLNENDLEHIEMIKALNTKLTEVEQRTSMTIVIHDAVTGENKPIEGLQHRQLGDAIVTLKSGEHLLMVAAAGCGKGKIARQSAQALGLRFLSLPGSLSPQSPVSQIIGYMNSTGQYVGTLFRDAFEHGGLIFLDELDNAHPACLAAVNDALALSEGEEIAFPDGMVKMHQDFRVAAAANTFGRGPDRTYAARQRGDAATWDRFAILTLAYDHALEDVLCRRVGLDQDQTVNIVRYVRNLRANVEKHSQSVPVVIGMRASIGMCRLIKAGMSIEDAIAMRCRRGMSEQDWLKITHNVLPLRENPTAPEPWQPRVFNPAEPWMTDLRLPPRKPGY